MKKLLLLLLVLFFSCVSAAEESPKLNTVTKAMIGKFIYAHPWVVRTIGRIDGKYDAFEVLIESEKIPISEVKKLVEYFILMAMAMSDDRDPFQVTKTGEKEYETIFKLYPGIYSYRITVRNKDNFEVIITGSKDAEANKIEWNYLNKELDVGDVF